MKLKGEGTLLRIFLGESDKAHQVPLYEQIVRDARSQGLAGATVLRGVEGFGANSRVIHTAKILRLSEDLPIIVEIVDTNSKMSDFLKQVEQRIEESGAGALITTESIEILRYSPDQQK
jgi:PII-like signaling protein